MDIQVDMFDVQLGAALLLQFNIDGAVVRVLADAGTSMSGYRSDHVLEKLKEVLPIVEGEPPPRIDLLIGTHYDMDHLNRMVPVIENYEIGEAWLPPVANDTEPPAADWEQPRDNNLLGVQFAGSNGNKKLLQYLERKADTIRTVVRVRESTKDSNGSLGLAHVLSNSGELASIKDLPLSLSTEGFFENALKSSAAAIGESREHACKDVRLPAALSVFPDDGYVFRYSLNDYFPVVALGANQTRSLGYIERSAAEDALTAKSLAKVVDALVAKQVSTRYEFVQDGQPRHFAWDVEEGRFIPAASKDASELTMTLLGPSRGLIAMYWERLPVGEYIRFALVSKLPVESITPQNELSYSMIFHCKEQGLLVTGDTGFVDFAPLDTRPSDPKFYPEMIDALRIALPVVQVAHHGGHNKYFYHALNAANYPLGESECYLLLSHEVESKSRPSRVFSQFMTRLGNKTSQVQVLLTSQPRRPAVKDYVKRIGPVVPKGSNKESGDVRLVYAGNKWKIKKHAIKV